MRNMTLPFTNRSYRWLMPVAGLFITTLIISNIIAVKLVSIGGLILPAAVILFPITYIIGDVLTEVYGYARARQVIWLGFICNLIAVVAIWVAGLLPPASFWNAGIYASPDDAAKAYHAILGFTPRLLVASRENKRPGHSLIHTRCPYATSVASAPSGRDPPRHAFLA